MAVSLTPPNLTSTTVIADADLLLVWPSASVGPLSQITWAAARAVLAPQLNGTFLQCSQNLFDLTNVTTARTNLGLGSAALANIGTSGNTVPVLNAANTWSATQTISISFSGNNTNCLFVTNPNGAANTSCSLSLSPSASIGHGGYVLATNDGAENISLHFGVYKSGAGQLEAIVADASGNVTLGPSAASLVTINSAYELKPHMPAFMVKLSADLTNVTGNGAAYNVVFNTAVVDRHSDVNLTTGIFTAPVTGLYRLSAFLTLTTLTASFNQFILAILTTAQEYQVQFGTVTRDVNNRAGMAMSILASMTSGDTAKVKLQVAGSTLTVGLLHDAAGGSAAPTCGFSGELVG